MNRQTESNKLKKVSISSVAILLVAVLLACFLISAIIVMKNKKGTPVKGQITNENIWDNTTYNYSLETTIAFKTNFRRYVINFLGLSEEDEKLISLNAGEFLLNYFRQAKISGEKAVNFSEYLAGVLKNGEANLELAESKEDFKGIWALIGFLSDVDVSNPTDKKIVFAPEKHIIKLFNLELYESTVRDILQHTMLNIDEIGRLFLEIFWVDIISSKGNNEVSLSKEEFLYAFESFVYIYTVGVDFLKEKPSIIQARTLSELIYESGVKLRSVIEKNGIDNFMKALGLDKPLPSLLDNPDFEGIMDDGNFVDSVAFINEVREVVVSNVDVFRFFIQCISHMMVNIENINMESVARAAQPATESPEKHIALSVISSTRTIKKGLDFAFNDNPTIKDKETLTEKVAEFLTVSKKVKTSFLTIEEEYQYKKNIKNDLIHYLNIVENTQNNFSDINSIEEVEQLTSVQVYELSESYKSNTIVNHIFIDDFSDILSTVFMNIAINGYLKLYKRVATGGK